MEVVPSEKSNLRNVSNEMDTDEENGTYTLTIKNPQMADGGRYTCTVRECNDLSCKGYLEVERKSASEL